MDIIPGTASRDDLVALRDAIERARYPTSAPYVSPASLRRLDGLASDIERSIRAEVLCTHLEPPGRPGAPFLPAELDPTDGA